MFKRIFHGFILLVFVAGLLAITPVAPAAAAGIIYVNVNAAGSNNGTSWANAFTSLQSALTSASSGDQVWVAAGVYKPTIDLNRAKSFELKTGVAIYGGFAGNELTLGGRNSTTNVTILSGDIGVVGDASDNSYHVVNGSSTISSAILDGFTITAGNAAAPADYGGGVYIFTGASPTLSNLIFSANHAAQSGGGMYMHISSSPSLTNVTFTGNSASRGGGMTSFGANPILTDVTFSNNTSNDMGGGMYNTDGGVPTLKNVTFNGNSATNAGGGMRNAVTNPSLTNVTFNGNSAPIGGGMQNLGSNPTLTNVTLSGNTAGGAIYNVSSDPIIRNSILYGNTGGEIVNSSGTPVVTYSIVQGGYAGMGNLNVNPLLGPIAKNGGFTQTMALGAGSPAIDAGTNTVCPATDQRGITRPQGSLCDIGAYESESSEQILNGGFNTYPVGKKIPTSWKAVNFSTSDGKNTINKKEGTASIKIIGAGVTKTFSQTLLLSGSTGDMFNFSYWVKGNAVPAAGTCRAQVLFYNGATLNPVKKALSCMNGTYAFAQKSLVFTAPGDYTKIVVKFTYSKASGMVWFDAVSLTR